MTTPGQGAGGGDIAVVGSLNLDVVVQVSRHPEPGETLLGHGHFDSPGGKGANQAVAAAKLGASVAMVGRVGDDAAGRRLRRTLVDAGVDDRGVATDDEARTGTAFITLSDAGENTIVVSPGANDRVGADDVAAHTDLLEDAAVCLLQLELPDAAVLAAAERATGIVVLNPAPARPLARELLDHVDVLVPNQTELALLAGADAPPRGADEARELARSLPVGRVVVTLGGDGALVVDGDDHVAVAAPRVDVVDTTGAGDAFCGALADALARGTGLADAARWAVAAGACAVRGRGAQSALPTREDVQRLRDAS